jgi:hypothetical protein
VNFFLCLGVAGLISITIIGVGILQDAVNGNIVDYEVPAVCLSSPASLAFVFSPPDFGSNATDRCGCLFCFFFFRMKWQSIAKNETMVARYEFAGYTN